MSRTAAHDDPGDAGVVEAAGGLDAWWQQLEAVALVGTARRPVPPGTPGLGVAVRPQAPPATVLLDAVAVVGAVRRAGRPAVQATAPPAAPPDVRESAPAAAAQMLDLLLTQPPAGARLRDDLVLAWCRSADRHSVRLPHAVLPALLELGAARPGLRPAIAAVLDERGTWLAARRPDWSWAAAGPLGELHAVEHDAWVRLPAGERTLLLRRLRHADQAAARDLLRSSWDADPATARKSHLEALADGLGHDDEAVLEAALDDRAATVRAVAVILLDALPASARAGRMRARLAPLVRLVRADGPIDVSLPDTPEPSGVRDGLERAPRGRSQRGWWLQRIVAGAPLEMWTELTGADPAEILTRLDSADVRQGLVEAALVRRDGTWAAALLRDQWDDRLVPVLNLPVRERLVRERLQDPLTVVAVTGLLAAAPGPWSASLSNAVVARLAAEPSPGPVLDRLGFRLAVDLHPDSLVLLRGWLARPGHPPRVASALRDLVQFLSLHRSIDEAFT